MASIATVASQRRKQDTPRRLKDWNFLTPEEFEVWSVSQKQHTKSKNFVRIWKLETEKL